MNVTIDDGFREFIEKKIKSGEFTNAEDVVATALSRWADNDGDFAPGELEHLLRPAIEEMERGEGIPFEQAMTMLDERIAEKKKKRMGA